ncbi:MAG: hypothetical protein UHD05_01485 [Ruminococcus sp.]|nr:hypothetical protein [Ruminococcus sp.]
MKKHGNAKLFSHILILALVLIIAVGATFSWYNRTVTSSAGSGDLLTYEQTGNINGEGGTIKTYAGTSDNGKITYSSEELSTASDTISTEPNAVNYFKTVITNVGDNDEALEDSIVSVYLEDFSYSSSLGKSSVHIGIIQPEKTYKEYNATLSGSDYMVDNICLEDNIPLAKGGTTEIYWFVEIDKNVATSGDVKLGTMHLVYN